MAPIMDKAANTLGIDRVEIRKINSTNNDTIVYAARRPVTSAYMEEALEKGAKMFDWENRKNQPKKNGNYSNGR